MLTNKNLILGLLVWLYMNDGDLLLYYLGEDTKDVEKITNVLILINKEQKYNNFTLDKLKQLLSINANKNDLLKKEIAIVLKRLKYNNCVAKVIVDMIEFNNFDDIYFSSYFSIDKKLDYYICDKRPTVNLYTLLLSFFFGLNKKITQTKFIEFIEMYNHVFIPEIVYDTFKFLKIYFLRILFPNVEKLDCGNGIVGDFIDNVLDHLNVNKKNIGQTELIFLFHMDKLLGKQIDENMTIEFLEKCYSKCFLTFFLHCVNLSIKCCNMLHKMIKFNGRLEKVFESKIVPSKELFKNVCEFVSTINNMCFDSSCESSSRNICIDISVFINYGYVLTLDDVCIMTEKYLHVEDIEKYEINLNDDKYYKVITETNFNPYNVTFPWTTERLHSFCLDKLSPTVLRKICEKNQNAKPDIECLKNLCVKNDAPIIKYVVQTHNVVPDIECLRILALRKGVTDLLKYMVCSIYDNMEKKNGLSENLLEFENSSKAESVFQTILPASKSQKDLVECVPKVKKK